MQNRRLVPFEMTVDENDRPAASFAKSERRASESRPYTSRFVHVLFSLNE